MLSDKHEIMLIEKLKDLPPEKLAEVEDFVDFLHERDEARKFAHASRMLTPHPLRLLSRVRLHLCQTPEG